MILAVRARVFAAVVVASLIAFAPVAADLCARSCESSVDQACPAHSPRPAPRCAHDHGVMSADLPRALSSASAPSVQQDAIVVSLALTVQMAGAEIPLTQLLHSPPHLAAPLPALRI